MTFAKYMRCKRALARFDVSGRNSTYDDSLGDYLKRKMLERDALVAKIAAYEQLHPSHM